MKGGGSRYRRRRQITKRRDDADRRRDLMCSFGRYWTSWLRANGAYADTAGDNALML